MAYRQELTELYLRVPTPLQSEIEFLGDTPYGIGVLIYQGMDLTNGLNNRHAQ